MTANTNTEQLAKAICAACEERPESPGDTRGNQYRWQDYLPVAEAAKRALSSPAVQASAAQVMPEGWSIKRSDKEGIVVQKPGVGGYYAEREAESNTAKA
jgi:hypothetical protein